jgi:hypothetical protein
MGENRSEQGISEKKKWINIPIYIYIYTYMAFI